MSPSACDRRRMLQTLLAGGVALPSGLRALLSSPEEVYAPIGARCGPSAAPLLLLIELVGGNDGLNSVVPYEDDRYRRLRPTLAYEPKALHRVADGVGFAPTLQGLAEHVREGRLAVVQGVGPLEPDRSHFVSYARWHQAELSPEHRGPGWLGRLLEPRSPQPLAGIGLGERGVPGAFLGARDPVAAAPNLEALLPDPALTRALASERLRSLDEVWGNAETRKRAAAGRELLSSLAHLGQAARKVRGFPDHALGRRLVDALAIARSGLQVAACVVRHHGYDTHARQGAAHARLMSELDGALSALLSALQREGLNERVMVVVHSEFGRRIAENGAGGTDHGAAGPVWIAGGKTPGGAHGARPDLGDALGGDVRPQVDYRRILAHAARHLDPQGPERLGWRAKLATPLFP